MGSFSKCKIEHKSSLAKASRMVRVHVKHGNGNGNGNGEFLYDTETTSTIDEITKDIIEIANLQAKIQCFAVELQPHLSKLQGDSKVMPLVRALSEATSYSSKDQVKHYKPLSLYVLRDQTRSIEKEFLITYSVMGLSSSDLQQFLSDLQILEENTVQLVWAGKELTRGNKLCDFIGKNEKTKIIIRLQSPPPASDTSHNYNIISKMASNVKICMALVAILFMISRGAMAQSDCMNAFLSMYSCLSYVTGSTPKTPPSSSCCSALSGVLQSQPRCLCTIANGGGSSLGVQINQTLALALPAACNLKTPPVSRCYAGNGPAMSPIPVGSPVGSPEGSSSDETADPPMPGLEDNWE